MLRRCPFSGRVRAVTERDGIRCAGVFAQHFKAVVHGAVNRQQGLGGDPIGGHLLLVQHLTTRLFTERGEAVHVLRREILVSKGGFIQRVVVVAARDPVQAQRLAPFATENIQEQVGTALAAADDGNALAREIRRAQHHLAGVEAAIVLRRDAVRQVDLLTDPHADVARRKRSRWVTTSNRPLFSSKLTCCTCWLKARLVRLSAAQHR